MKKTFLLTCILLVTTVATVRSGEFCSEDAVCMVIEHAASKVRVLFRNKLPMPNQISTVTFEVSPKLVNLTGPDRFPLTRVVKGPETAEVTVLSIVEPSGYWNTNLRFCWQHGSPAEGKEPVFTYRLPFGQGAGYRVCQAFNGKISHFDETRYAVDFLMPIGTPIHAARDGIVVSQEGRQEEGRLEPAYRTKSNYIIIQHDDGSVGRYFHLVKGGVKTALGQQVKAGDLIGLSGNSGYSDVPHLHFEVRRPVNGRESRSIPFAFTTDYAESDTPKEGVVYRDSGLTEKNRFPVSPDGIVLCASVKEHRPDGITETVPAGGESTLFIPIDIPGVHSINLLMYNGEKRGAPSHVSWQTGKTWWYTTFPVKAGTLHGGAGRWKAEVSVNRRLVKTLEFTVE